MPADTTESVAEHSARLPPTINLHAPVTAALVAMYYPGGMKVWVSPVQWSNPYIVYWPPLRIRTRVGGFKIISGDHYTTTAQCWAGCQDAEQSWENLVPGLQSQHSNYKGIQQHQSYLSNFAHDSDGSFSEGCSDLVFDQVEHVFIVEQAD